MKRGCLKWFSPARGYGLIKPDDGSDDVFVHINVIERSRIRDLAEGSEIRFEPMTDQRTGKPYAQTIDRVRSSDVPRNAVHRVGSVPT